MKKGENTPPEIREYLSSIGRRGGRKKSPAKTAAARANVMKRWKRQPAPLTESTTRPMKLARKHKPLIGPEESQ